MISLFSANRVMKVGLLSFLLPFIVLATGIFLMAKPDFIGEAIGVVAGASLIVYGASELLSSWKMKKAIDEYEIRQTRTDAPVREENPLADVRDVEYEKVDEQ